MEGGILQERRLIYKRLYIKIINAMKNKMRTYLYFFFGILVVNLFYLKHMYCQNSGVDTATVILNAKINILALETSIKSTEEIKNIMDSDIKYEILESKGFNEDVR